jgi:hypothetical protein
MWAWRQNSSVWVLFSCSVHPRVGTEEHPQQTKQISQLLPLHVVFHNHLYKLQFYSSPEITECRHNTLWHNLKLDFEHTFRIWFVSFWSVTLSITMIKQLHPVWLSMTISLHRLTILHVSVLVEPSSEVHWYVQETTITKGVLASNIYTYNASNAQYIQI